MVLRYQDHSHVMAVRDLKKTSELKILHISASDIEGGAARATYRLHQGLKAIGVNSQILVQEKSSDDETVIGPKTRFESSLKKSKLTFDAFPLKFYSSKQRTGFSLQWTPSLIIPEIVAIDPDIVHLHWINNAFLKIEDLQKIKKPIVWTLHDMWPFTGGCHYARDCDRYENKCGACPTLGSQQEADLSRWVWKRKTKGWENIDLTVVSPSKWLAECAERSSLFRSENIRVISHGLDLNKYRPIDKNTARSLLKLPLDKNLILFGAIGGTKDERKGFRFLVSAIKELIASDALESLEILVFGSSNNSSIEGINTIPYNCGKLNDDISLAVLYSAADVMIVPSIQEAFGQTAAESLACGTPVISFKTTGLIDIVEHKENGYLADCFDPHDLAHGISWILEDRERYQDLRKNARRKAELDFNLILQSQKHCALYKDVFHASLHY